MSMRPKAPIAAAPAPIAPVQLVSEKEEFSSREEKALKALTVDQLGIDQIKPLEELNAAHLKNLKDANRLESHFLRRIEAYRAAHTEAVA